MIRNFIVTTLRIFWRNKITSTVNVLSLAFGIAAFLLIMIYVHQEYKIDKFNTNYDRIFRLESTRFKKLPFVVSEKIIDRFAQIENVTRIYFDNDATLSYIDTNNGQDRSDFEIEGVWADSSLFEVFSFKLLMGNPQSVLRSPNTAVLTATAAKNIFGEKDPVGESIICENEIYTITGIMEDITQAHFSADVVLSYQTLENQYKVLNLGIDHYAVYFLLLNSANNAPVLSLKLNEELEDLDDGHSFSHRFEGFELTPLKDIYFHDTHKELDYGNSGNKVMLQIFIATAFLILLLASINYINLSIARALTRFKEIAIKKVVGSSKLNLRIQFLLESLLFTIISFVVAVTFIQASIPYYNNVLNISVELEQYFSASILLYVVTGLVLLTLISGYYPAIYMSNVRSTSLIKGGKTSGFNGLLFRKILLTFQFSISIFLIIGIITSFRQIIYAKTSNLGFEEELVLVTKVPNIRPKSVYSSLGDKLNQHSGIIATSFSNTPIIDNGSAMFPMIIDEKKEPVSFMAVNPDYFDLYGLSIKDGRGFDWNQSDLLSDSNMGRLVINETMAKKYWSQSPVGEIVQFDHSDMQAEIIGVVQDFHQWSFHEPIKPIFFVWHQLPFYLNIKISASNVPETIEFIETEWKNSFEGLTKDPFQNSFVEESIDGLYKGDEQKAKVLGFFTFLAISISCMGLFALLSFMAVRRTKEIGIRKILGASSKRIFLLLSIEYIKLILIASMVASPIAWFAMNKWLQTFAYRIELGPGVFILAAFLALAIGLITVGWQALKSAVANPVEALRYE